MTFTSLTFILFCPLVFALYWTLKTTRRQNVLLLIASYIFYGWWDYRFCGLMLISSVFDFAIGVALDETELPSRRRWWLGLSLVGNLGLLGFFKYFNFFADSAQQLASALGWQLNPGTLEIILPVGISFYTFQSLGYTIDVYRRDLKPARNLIDYLTFVSFFPQLVAGPIERATHLLPQIAGPRNFEYGPAVDGCRQILLGFFKKLVIADRLAAVVNPLFAQSTTATGPEMALAAVCFAFQVYCDFSAYSDIAVGTARLFGIQLMRNFHCPYFSQSVGEFWRRWHISLSTWFRDYLYVPLGGSRVSASRRAVNTMITFVVSGLWHGAAWKFAAWGALHGVAVLGTKSAAATGSRPHTDTPGGEGMLPRPAALARMMLTFTICCLGLVIFRARSLADATSILGRIVSDVVSWDAYRVVLTHLASDRELRFTLILLAAFVAVEWIQRRQPHILTLGRLPTGLRWSVYTLFIWCTLDWQPKGGGQEFFYFDF